MGEQRPTRNTFEKDGWTLISAEARQAAHPHGFRWRSLHRFADDDGT
jgi:hypothetical protein